MSWLSNASGPLVAVASPDALSRHPRVEHTLTGLTTMVFASLAATSITVLGLAPLSLVNAPIATNLATFSTSVAGNLNHLVVEAVDLEVLAGASDVVEDKEDALAIDILPLLPPLVTRLEG